MTVKKRIKRSIVHLLMSNELSRKALQAPSPGRLLQDDFPGDAPEGEG